MPRRSSWCWRCCGTRRDSSAGERSRVLVHLAVRHEAELRRSARAGHRGDEAGCICRASFLFCQPPAGQSENSVLGSRRVRGVGQAAGGRNLRDAVRGSRPTPAGDHGAGVRGAVERHRSECCQAPEAIPAQERGSRINIGFRRTFILVKRRSSLIIPIVPIDPNSLPKDPEILQRMLVDLTTQLDKTQRLLRQLMEAKSGTRSEQLSADQLRLFAQELNLAELTPAETEKNEDELPPGSASRNNEDQEESRPRGRRPLPPHLKRERIEHDLTAEEKHRAWCQQDLHPIGEESSERYEYLPAQLLVIEDVCKKYACACTVKTASKPPQPIEIG